MRYGTTNMYLFALALYDSCVLIFNFMIGVLRGQNTDVNKTFQENEWLCLIHSVVVELFNLQSVWMIVCFTIERYIAVRFPLKVSQLCSVKRTKMAIGLVSTTILIISIHKIFISGFEGDSVFGYKACWTNRKKYREVMYFYVAFNTWLPAVIITILNLLILSIIRQSMKVRQRMSVKSQRQKRANIIKREIHITRTLLFTSIAYVVLLLPLGTIQTTELWMKSAHQVSPSSSSVEQESYISYTKIFWLLKWIRCLSFFLYQFNFSINFFIYLATNLRFRFTCMTKFRAIIPSWLYKRYCPPSFPSVRKNQARSTSLRFSDSTNCSSSRYISTIETTAGSSSSIDAPYFP